MSQSLAWGWAGGVLPLAIASSSVLQLRLRLRDPMRLRRTGKREDAGSSGNLLVHGYNSDKNSDKPLSLTPKNSSAKSKPIHDGRGANRWEQQSMIFLLLSSWVSQRCRIFYNLCPRKCEIPISPSLLPSIPFCSVALICLVFHPLPTLLPFLPKQSTKE